MYVCEVPGCNRQVMIRSKIRSGSNKGLKGCSVCAAKAKPPKIPGKKIKKVSEKTLIRNRERSSIRNTYFEHHLPLISFSEESLIRIPYPSRANCCHILPKSRHPSVQAHIQNVVYLTLDQHTRFDYLLDTLQIEKIEKEFPRSWPLVCDRLRVILPLCTERSNLSFKLEEYLKTKT